MYGTLADLLNEKGRQVYTIPRAATVCEAVREMDEKGVGALLIMSGAEPVGIFTERDVLRRVVHVARDPMTARVVEVMTPHPVVARRDMRVEEAMTIMTNGRFRHLPVVDATGAVVGLASIGDVMRWMTIHQQSDIDHMTDYITGRRPA